MTDTANLSAREAMDEISKLQGVDQALARRTAGLTWMVWGIVSPAIFLTYGALGTTLRLMGLEWVNAILWVPFVLMGVLATVTLWRSVGLVIPVERNGEGARRGVVATGIFLAAIYGVFALTGLLDVGHLLDDMVVLAGLGVASLALGATGYLSADALDRRLWLVAGILLLVAALAGSALLGTLERPLVHAAGTAYGAGVSALVYFGAGLFLANRG